MIQRSATCSISGKGGEPFFNMSVKSKLKSAITHLSSPKYARQSLHKDHTHSFGAGCLYRHSVMPKLGSLDLCLLSHKLFSTQPPIIEAKRSKLNQRKRQIVTLTDKAIDQLYNIAGDSGKIVKLFFVVKGCNGYSYEMELVDMHSLDSMDEIVRDCNGTPILAIENKAVFHLLGSRIDYHVSQLEEGFIFDNPNITSKCGCGQSFQF